MNETSALELIFDSVVVIVVSYLIGLVSSRLIAAVARRKGYVSKSNIFRELGRAIQRLLLVIGVVIAAKVTGLASEIEALTILGLVGLGFTLYIEDLVSEAISTFIMIQHKVLRENDQIMIREVKGRVVRITARHTFIKTEEGTVVLVGNSFLARGPLVNYTASERLKDEPWFTGKT